ncbi:MAG TPA: hypothetical protein PKA64_02840 [Myxococcota bacterium]|nr:hypothetical protein [Myxococcota bacterium]
MSRASRPLRRVRGAARTLLALDVVRLLGDHPALDEHLERAARLLACRPAQLRRCLRGLPVSARAAARIFSNPALLTR